MVYQVDALAGDVRAFPVPVAAGRISEVEKRTLATSTGLLARSTRPGWPPRHRRQYLALRSFLAQAASGLARGRMPSRRPTS